MASPKGRAAHLALRSASALRQLGRAWPAVALVAVVAAFYGPATGRYFTSEDFLLLRVLGERPPWRDLVGTVAAPWLGVTIVKFYRPIATVLFALEGVWFRVNPLPFNMAHVAVHTANAFLVAALARGLQRRFLPDLPDNRTSWLAAFLFAVYPLHPNAVLFIASFATLFATFFLLATAVLYCRYREGEGLGNLAASVAFFALALGSYESAAVLPGLLVALEVLAPRARRGTIWSRMTAPVRALTPYAALALGYLVLRRAIFGVFIGGYDDMAALLTTFHLRVLAENLATSVYRLALPFFDEPPSRAASLGVLGVAVLAPAALYLVSRHQVASGYAGLSLFAAGWALAFMAPFSFVPVVPANGRYWYTVTVGTSIGLVAFVRWLGAAFPRLALAAMGIPVVVAIGWGWLLSANIAVNREAARTARSIQTAVAEVALTDGATRRYLTGYPLFLRNRAGVNLAQVFHYGLWDALSPPFIPGSGLHAYPLPPLASPAFAPLVSLPGARLYVWVSAEGRLHPLAMPSVPARLALAGPPDGADPSALPSPALIAVPSARGQYPRLVVLAAGNWNIVEGGTAQGHATLLTLPQEFVQAMGHLYPRRELLWWVVVEDSAGRVLAVSETRRLVWGADLPGPVLPWRPAGGG